MALLIGHKFAAGLSRDFDEPRIVCKQQTVLDWLQTALFMTLISAAQ